MEAPATSLGVQPPGTGPLLTLKNISKRFGATQALDNVSIDFARGEIHCLLGENGAGKSTIGKIVGGLYSADNGELCWNKQPVRFRSINESKKCGIGLVFQELSLAPHLSVRANAQLGATPQSALFTCIKHREESESVKSALARLGLSLDVEQLVGELPTATQQMVEIAKTLMRSPDLVVFDEPTAMLGAVEKQKLFDVLRNLRDQGVAIIMITHHIDDVLEVADRVSIMRNGKIVDSFSMGADITADTILERLTGKKISVNQRADHSAEQRDVVLEIRNLESHRSELTAMNIRSGEVIGLYGVVGSGADVIAKQLVGLAQERKLEFKLNGRPYLSRNPAHAVALGIAYLPSGRASNGIFATLSIKENLSLALFDRLGRYGVVSQKKELTYVDELLAKFNVKYGTARDLITSLSGGNQQKVLMARVIARSRKVLVLEEPTAGIDIEAKMSIHERIRELAQTGVCVVLVSSDLFETVSLCDTVYTMYAGAVVNKYSNPTLSDQPSIISDVLGQKEEAQDSNAVCHSS
ncbi:sugar ABC transporter [Pusillimonas sp. T2]|nr:sugar ABC transporter [Pusillimonas sp. T2]